MTLMCLHQRAMGEHVASPTASHSKYLQRLRRDYGRPAQQLDERVSERDALEQALKPIQSTLEGINSAIQQQQTDRDQQTIDSGETKKHLTDLVSAVSSLQEQVSWGFHF